MKPSYSVTDLCDLANISKALFYKSIRDGWGPRVTKIGRRTIITADAAETWLKEMEERSNV